MKAYNIITKSAVVTLLLAALSGCATYSKIITASSTVSHDMATNEINESIQEAEKIGCKAISVGAGVGIGFSAVECGADDSIDGQTVYTTHVLLRCPKEKVE